MVNQHAVEKIGDTSMSDYLAEKGNILLQALVVEGL